MLFAVVVGVAIPLAAFRLFVPNESFPVNYRRGRTAHLDVTAPDTTRSHRRWRNSSA